METIRAALDAGRQARPQPTCGNALSCSPFPPTRPSPLPHSAHCQASPPLQPTHPPTLQLGHPPSATHPGVCLLSATPRYPEWAEDVEAGCAGCGLRVRGVPVGAALPPGEMRSGWFANTRLVGRLVSTHAYPSTTQPLH